jgi:hypothetical protein
MTNQREAPGDTASDRWASLHNNFLILNKPKICFLTWGK